MGGSMLHPLGTDQLGRDIATRVIYGGRVSLLVGASAVIVGGGFGLLPVSSPATLGAASMRCLCVWEISSWRLPFVLLALAVLAAVGPGVLNVILVLSVGQWVEYARVTRGEVLGLREREFVLAARVIGVRDRQIVVRHILPNVLPTVIVIGSLAVGNVILTEASLTFLGSGVGLETASWGGMIAQARDVIAIAPWIAAGPGVVLMLTILSINIIGDWLRDVLDPRLRSSA
jgi:peptide/nickel transport system permease protein